MQLVCFLSHIAYAYCARVWCLGQISGRYEGCARFPAPFLFPSQKLFSCLSISISKLDTRRPCMLDCVDCVAVRFARVCGQRALCTQANETNRQAAGSSTSEWSPLWTWLSRRRSALWCVPSASLSKTRTCRSRRGTLRCTRHIKTFFI